MEINKCVLVLLVALVITGCVSTPTWDLNGKDEQQFRDDEIYCTSMVRVNRQPVLTKKYENSEIIPTMEIKNPPDNERTDLYDMCMVQFGYTRLR